MKRIGPMWKAFAAILVLVVTGCGSLGSGSAGKASALARIGVLVIRVGNTVPVSPMGPITRATDFRVRTPTSKTNVFIETADRLASFAPAYPEYPGNRPDWQRRFYSNMTPEITAGIVDFLESRGYAAADVRARIDESGTPVSELSVSEILPILDDSMDGLLVLEYMDIADAEAHIHSLTYGDIEASTSGLTAVLYTYSLFDTRSGPVIFSYAPIGGFSLKSALLADPRVLADAAIQSKVEHQVRRTGSETEITVHHTLSRAELIGLFVAQILHGSSPLPQSVTGKEYGDTPFSMFESKALGDFLPVRH